MSLVTAALLVVSDDNKLTHLVGFTPAVAGARPSDRDVLCGADYACDSPVPVVEIDCGECLIASQPYWGLPSWTEAQLP